MSIEAGQTLSHYRVVDKLGEGGMGEVWRAEDTKLGRQVALKVLPRAFVADEARLARFSREAQLLASLNHPNIAGIHGIEEAGSVTALVLELVEGETLEERIERGIIHRDLKPGNVKFSADGRVKVLDFGLAKALDTEPQRAEATHSPTLSLQQATEAGVILGTAAYMAPEQAAGKTADARADVWAFGVVLFEMLTGRRPFGGESVSYVLASVLKDEPDLAALPDAVPPRLRGLIARGSLSWIENGLLLQAPITPDGRADGPASTLAEGVEKFSISDEGTLLLDRQATRDLYGLFWVDLDGGRTPDDVTPLMGFPSFSPDGRFLAGHYRGQAGVHDVARGITTEPLPDQVAEILLSWSADGKDILFSSRRGGSPGMYRMAADGSGEPELLITDEDPPFRSVAGTAHDGRSIVYCQKSADTDMDIWLLPEGEERRALLATPAKECGTLYGDGRWLVYASNETGQTELFARAVEGPGRWQLTTTGVQHTFFMPSRNEVYYMLPGKLMRIRLETAGYELVPGPPEVRVEGRFPTLGVDRLYAVAPDGRVLLPELDPEAAASQARLEVWLGWGD